MAINGATLAIGKGYTNLVALGLSDVTVNGTTITFTLNDGETADVTLPTPKDGEKGDTGVSIVDVVQTDNKHFKCIFSDGTESDVVELPVGVAYDDTEIRGQISEAEEIAKGRSKGYVFDTVADLDAALLDEEFTSQLVLGDNLYIRATNVPDYWWDGSAKQQLETQKVDMTEYAKKSDIPTVPSGIITASTVGNTGDYAVSDGKGGVNWTSASNGDGYSTTETRVGTWIDGKPIYRKVVNFTTPASGTNTIISLGTNSDIKHYYGYIFDKDGNSVPMNYYYDTSCFVSTWAKGNSTTSNKYYVRCMTGGYGSCDGYAVIEYTKS